MTDKADADASVTEIVKPTRKRKGVSDRTLYKYTKIALKRFDLTVEDPVDDLLGKLREAVMDGDTD